MGIHSRARPTIASLLVFLFFDRWHKTLNPKVWDFPFGSPHSKPILRRFPIYSETILKHDFIKGKWPNASSWKVKHIICLTQAMDNAIVEIANQFSLESSRNSTSEVTVGRLLKRSYMFFVHWFIHISVILSLKFPP